MRQVSGNTKWIGIAARRTLVIYMHELGHETLYSFVRIQTNWTCVYTHTYIWTYLYICMYPCLFVVMTHISHLSQLFYAITALPLDSATIAMDRLCQTRR